MRSLFFYILRFVIFAGISLGIFLWAKGITFDPLTQQVYQQGMLQLDTIPTGATTTIQGIDYGKTPLGGIRLLPGQYHVHLQQKDYYPWEKKIDITTDRVVSYEQLLLLPQKTPPQHLHLPETTNTWILGKTRKKPQGTHLILCTKTSCSLRSTTTSSWKEQTISATVQNILKDTGNGEKTLQSIDEATQELLSITSRTEENTSLRFSLHRLHDGQQLFTNTLYSPTNHLVKEDSFVTAVLEQRTLFVITNAEIFRFAVDSRRTNPLYQIPEGKKITAGTLVQTSGLFANEELLFAEYTASSNRYDILRLTDSKSVPLFSCPSETNSVSFENLPRVHTALIACTQNQGNRLFLYNGKTKFIYPLGENPGNILGSQGSKIWYSTLDGQLHTYDSAQRTLRPLSYTEGNRIQEFVSQSTWHWLFALVASQDDESLSLIAIDEDGENATILAESVIPSNVDIISCGIQEKTLLCLYKARKDPSNHNTQKEQPLMKIIFPLTQP